jgi:hypothetical protein
MQIVEAIASTEKDGHFDEAFDSTISRQFCHRQQIGTYFARKMKLVE